MDPYERYARLIKMYAGKSPAEMQNELLCVVCQKICLPPIRSCQNFHSICNSCTYTIVEKMCPNCNGNIFLNQRNEDLESYILFLHLPCNNHPACKTSVPGHLTAQHEFNCSNGQLSCPMEIPGCNWRGSASQFFLHCKKEHGLERARLNNQLSDVMNIKRPKESFTCTYTMFMFRRGQYKVIVQCFPNFMKFHMFQLFPYIDIETTIFYIEIIIKISESNQLKFKMKGCCPVINGTEPLEYLLLNEDCVTTPLSFLRVKAKHSVEFTIFMAR